MVLRKLRVTKPVSLANTLIDHKTLLLLLFTLAVSTSTFADETPEFVLTASSTATINEIIANSDFGEWTFVGLQATNNQAAMSFKGGDHKVTILIAPPSTNVSPFTLTLGPKDVPNPESTILLDRISDLLTANQPKDGFWTKQQTLTGDVWTMAQKGKLPKTWEDNKLPEPITHYYAPTVLPIDATLNAGLVMFMALFLTIATSLIIWLDNRKSLSITKTDLIWLVVVTIAAFILRSIGDAVVPGWVNGHGHRYISDILHGSPRGADLHGNGPWAFYIPLLMIFPRTLNTILIIQAVVSALTIPAIFFMTKAFVSSSTTARWTAVLAALLPGFVYLGHSEERMVIAILFLILAPTFGALASRFKNHLSIFASAALAATSAHFSPFMLLSPVVIFAVLICRSDGRSYLKTPWPWLGLVFYMLLVFEPASQAFNNLFHGVGPAGNWSKLVKGLKHIGFIQITPEPGKPTNAYFSAELTPYVFQLLSLLGFVSLHLKKSTKPAAWTLLALGVMFLVVAGAATRMNAIRLQFPAQPWFLVLSGAGLTAISSLARKYCSNVPKPLRTGIILTLLIGLVVLDPGPMFKTFGPHQETKALLKGIAQVPEGCVIVWPSMSRKSGSDVPTWATLEQKKLVFWYALRDFEEARRPFPPCLYYLRPLACHDRQNPFESDTGDGMRAECVFIEQQLGRMSPVHVETIVAEPDCFQEYRPGPVEIGVWKVNTEPQP